MELDQTGRGASECEVAWPDGSIELLSQLNDLR